jgi:hypothetical protein
MEITVEGCSGKTYSFDGPYTNTNYLSESSGVYLILSKNLNGEYVTVDIGESANVKQRVEYHDRVDCWQNNSNSQLYVAVLYTPNEQQAGRMEIEQDIRCSYDFPCGKK